MEYSSTLRRHLPLVYLAFFCAIIAVISTLWGYQYFGNNSEYFLPQIIRAINPSYLSNDFFVNSTSGPSSSSFVFTQLVAWLAGVMPLTIVYLGLTLLSHFMIALISALFARDLFDGSDGVALVAALTVMSVKTFQLGIHDNFYYSPLEPSLLAMPFVLACVWAALRQRPLLSAFLAGLATLLHPLVGPEVGGIMLGVLGIEQLAHYFRPDRFPRKTSLLKLLGAGAILAVFCAPVMIPLLNIPHVSASQFIQIYAYFRIPHHIVPSTWGLSDYLEAAIYLLGAGILWRLCFPVYNRLKQLTPALLALCAILLGLCLGGYIFVELIPSRLWVTLQCFRLLFIVKWIGLCLTGGWIGDYIGKALSRRGEHEQGRQWMVVNSITLLSGLLSPWNLLLVSSYQFLQKRVKAAWVSSLPAVLTILTGSLIVAVIYEPERRVYFLVPFYAIMVFILFYLRSRWLSVGLVSLMAIVLLLPNLLPARFSASQSEFIMSKPAFSLQDLKDQEADLGAFARQYTPTDAIILVDPEMSLFRLIAERAIVVDWKDFPFTDQNMVEWQQRLFDCYGVPKSIGFNGRNELSKLYAKITDDKLASLHIKYGFSYAVLHLETKSQYPVLYKTKGYKIVQIK